MPLVAIPEFASANEDALLVDCAKNTNVNAIDFSY